MPASCSAASTRAADSSAAMTTALAIGKGIGLHQAGGTQTSQNMYRGRVARERIGYLSRTLRQIYVGLGQCRDFLLLLDRQPVKARTALALSLDRRHASPLDRRVEHAHGKPKQPGERLVVIRGRVEMQARGSEGLGREIVGEGRVADASQQDRDEWGEPAGGDHLKRSH